ncbi:MAG: urea transporter [Odoribacter sp.]
METTTTIKLPAVFSPGFFKLYFKGAGQVMFQGNIWTGIFFLAGIFYGAYEAHMPAVAWGAVAGMFMSTITGYLLKYPAEKGLEGLWGFNGILVGCALPTFLGNVPLMWLAIVIFSAMTTWVMVGLNYLLAPYKVSSLPFRLC